jgi:hypothetical protein
MYNPEDDLRNRWFQERDEAIERALEPQPVSSGMQSQDAKPEGCWYCGNGGNCLVHDGD